MLVFVAFANIFGGEHAKTYEMKSMLPKLVTGMLIVPFTWFIVSAVLSVSNILTASVISLPVETILKAGWSTTGLLADKIIPKTIVFNKDVDYWTGAKEEVGNDNVGSDTNVIANGNFYASDCKTAPDSCLTIKEFLTNGGWGAYNLLSVYAYGIFRIQDYKAITTEQKINKIIDIASKLGFWIIFFIVFGILVIAIVYALLSRAFMLWLYAMFSPVFALTFVLGDKAKKLEKFTVKEFISLALVPVYVSAALAFGLMFLWLVMGTTSQWTTWTDGKLKSDVVDITTTKSTTTFAFWNADQGIKFTTIGLLTPEVKSWTSKALDLGKWVIGTIIMNILALVILWMAVMAALGASKITEAAVAPIKWFGDEIGKLAMKAPQYIPIPLPGKDKDGHQNKINMAGLQNMGQQINSSVAGAAGASWTEFGQKFGNSIAGALGYETNKVLQEIDRAIQSKNWIDAISKLATSPKNDATKEILGGKMDITNQQTRNKISDTLGGIYKLKLEEIESLKKNGTDSAKFDNEIRTIAKNNKDLSTLIETNGSITEKIGNHHSTGTGNIIITPPDDNHQITVNSITATITPAVAEKAAEGTKSAVPATKAKISNIELGKLLTELKKKSETKDITEAELKAKLATENIDIW